MKRLDERYLKYIQSDDWKKLSDARKAVDGHKCVVCGSNSNLQVHHLHYKNFGKENINDDLITLCKECHEWVHDNKDFVIKGICAGVMILKIDLREFLSNRGISKNNIEIFIENIKDRMGVMYIPIPEDEGGGAVTVPFCDCFSEKDIKAMADFCGEDFNSMIQSATIFYRVGLENQAHIEIGRN